MPTSADVQLYDGMLSGSVFAQGYPTDLLIDGTDPDWANAILSVSHVLLTSSGVQSNSGLVLIRLAVWFSHPVAGNRIVHSFRLSAAGASGNSAGSYSPPVWPGPIAAPAPGSSLVLGYQAQAGQPNPDTSLVAGLGSVRCWYGATTTAGATIQVGS